MRVWKPCSFISMGTIILLNIGTNKSNKVDCFQCLQEFQEKHAAAVAEAEAEEFSNDAGSQEDEQTILTAEEGRSHISKKKRKKILKTPGAVPKIEGSGLQGRATCFLRATCFCEMLVLLVLIPDQQDKHNFCMHCLHLLQYSINDCSAHFQHLANSQDSHSNRQYC